VYVLFFATAIYLSFQTTMHIGTIHQTAVTEGIITTGGIHTNDRASLLFIFLRHPEYVKIGMSFLFQEGHTTCSLFQTVLVPSITFPFDQVWSS
jgi:GTPase